MTEYTVPITAVRLWRIRLIIIGIFAAFICGALAALTPVIVPVITCAVFSALGLFLFIFYIPRLHKSYRIILSEEAVVLIRGVFIRHQYIMPCPRMIYAERFRTPLLAALHIQGVRLMAARARLTIPALSLRDAEDVLSFIGMRYGEKEV